MFIEIIRKLRHAQNKPSSHSSIISLLLRVHVMFFFLFLSCAWWWKSGDDFMESAFFVKLMSFHNLPTRSISILSSFIGINWLHWLHSQQPSVNSEERERNSLDNKYSFVPSFLMRITQTFSASAMAFPKKYLLLETILYRSSISHRMGNKGRLLSPHAYGLIVLSFSSSTHSNYSFWYNPLLEQIWNCFCSLLRNKSHYHQT